jgi:sigma-E factor negative regulatory protein RseB
VSRSIWGGVASAIYLFASPAWADDSLALLQKIAQGARHLTYSGIFVYRSGNKVETSRIVHTQIDGRERERIEVLDGSPREVIRDGNEVKCFIPDEQLLIVENLPRQRGFPSMLPAGLGRLLDHYTIRSGRHERFAGLESLAIQLEPRDQLRYRHEFLVDAASGLMLKAVMLGEHGEILEAFAFSQIKIGGTLDPDAFKPHFDPDRVRVQQVRATQVRVDDIGWNFKASMPGFRRVAATRRQASSTQTESLHVVFSDGLASISVFIEPGSADESVETLAQFGPVNVYRRQLGGHRLMVMGEVPAVAVKRLADGIERRMK